MRIGAQTLAIATLVSLATVAGAEDARSPAAAVAAASAPSDGWRSVREVKFTWKHVPSGRERTHEWDRVRDTVTVTTDGVSRTVSASGRDLETQEDIDAHRAFVNDSYWLLFEQFIATDRGVAVSAGAPSKVPGLPSGPTLDTVVVQYQGDGGYTPGDRYVLYLDPKSGRPAWWAYHPGGQAEPKVVTSRQGWGSTTSTGVAVPLVFKRPNDETFVAIRLHTMR